jgi:hypothetical protein
MVRQAHSGGRGASCGGTAEHVPGFPAADQMPEYVAKYTERIGALFGTASRFAALFPAALIITPHRLHA